MSVESDRLSAAHSLALLDLKNEVRDMRNDLARRASFSERAMTIAGKLQSRQALSLAVSFAITITALAMAVPLFIGGMILATQDPAAVLAFVADLFHLTRGGV